MSSLSNCELYDRRMKRSIAWRQALIAALIAVAIFNPFTFGLVNGLTTSLFGKPNIIATGKGRPTTLGLIVHAVVLLIIVYIISYLAMKPSDRPLVCCDPNNLQVSTR